MHHGLHIERKIKEKSPTRISTLQAHGLRNDKDSKEIGILLRIKGKWSGGAQPDDLWHDVPCMHFATLMDYTQCYGCLIELCSRGLRQGIHAPKCKHLNFVSESNEQRAEA